LIAEKTYPFPAKPGERSEYIGFGALYNPGVKFVQWRNPSSGRTGA
jgi:hypothetical protein